MRAAVLVLAVTLAGCGFEHGALGGGSGSDDAGTIDGGVDAPAVAWWDPAFGFRMPLTITNSSTTTLPLGYQVGVSHAFYSAPCKGQRDDVRFVFGSTELNRAFDDVMPTPWAWFPLAAPLAPGATSTGEYFIYCGNPNPGSGPSNPKALFELYDAFGSASLDTTLWTNVRGSTLNNGRLVVGGGGQTDNGVISKTSFGVNNAVDFIIVASQATTAMPGFWAGFEGSTTDGPPYTIWWTLDTSNMIAPSYKITTASTDYRGTPFAFTTAAHYYSVEHYGKGTMYRYDDVPYDTQAYDVAYTSPLFIRLWNYNSSPSVAYDMVRVRQAVDPPPAVVVGAPVAKP